jgi:anaerobic magnesium-protoporphyrin IX monomethyl ester cyclase
MNTLLINPINRENYRSGLRFPLGLAYVSGALTEAGHRVQILDLATIDWNITGLEAKVSTNYEDIDIIGLTGLITEYKNIRDISALFKKYYPKKPIILGGPFATSLPNEILNNTPIDIIVSGEGEETCRQLFQSLSDGKDISCVSGIYFKENGLLRYTGERPYIQSIDDINFPSRNNFNVEAYFRNSPLAMFGSRRSLNMITSRGCPYSCLYCNKGMWGDVYRARSPQNMVNEIKYLIDNFGIDSLVFHDDTFNMNKQRVIEFCDLLIDNKIHIDWLANCRINTITQEVAQKMRKAGCRIIAYGVESGNQDILNSMKKGVKIEKVSEAIRITWKAGIIPFGYLMIGWLDETKEQALDTIKFCIDNNLIGDFSFFTPLPQTPAFFKAKEKSPLLDEELLLSHWGEWHITKVVNVSAMTDDELVSLKRYAERKIVQASLLRKVFLFIRSMGIYCFFREIIRRIVRYGMKGLNPRCE